MKKTKLILACTGLALVAGLTSCGGVEDPDGYTYRGYTSALATNWNPHAWETNADSSVLSYLSEGFVSLQPKDTEKGIYQWAYDMAESVTDVTFTDEGKAALKKYVGASDDDVSNYEAECAGEPGKYVYQIKLREGLKFEDGTVINASSFIESGKRLLDPSMKNYRANLYISGESAIAGAYNYYYQGSTGYFNGYSVAEHYDETTCADFVFTIGGTKTIGDYTVFESSKFNSEAQSDYNVSGQKLLEMYAASGYLTTEVAEGAKEIEGKKLSEILANADYKAIWDAIVSFWKTEADEELYFLVGLKTIAEADWDASVGLYKVDDLTFNYVMNTPLDLSQTLVSFADTWLVHTEKYDANLDKTGALVTTKYGTSVDATVSFGPYKLKSLEADKQMVLVQNENWHGYTKTESGKLYSETLFEVNGAKVQQYQTTKVVIDVLTDAAAKQKFLAGELTEYSPTSSELSEYTLSDALYQVDETYTMSFFFNTNEANLKAMDVSKGNKNSVVLTNTKFRKAMSLAIDRAEFVTATAAYTPAYALMNDLYHYDIWNNPESSYRHSEPAMQAVCNLYGVEYGDGKAYATLEDAYASITGFNLTEAKNLMKEAHDELVASGLYTGGDIHIKVAYSKGAIQSDEQAQMALLNKYMAQAIEGSGFASFTLEAVGNVEDRYGAVPAGEYAIGYGAWGGAAFYPFRNMQVYCDPDQYDVNELACWDPKTEELQIKFDYVEEGVSYNFDDTLTWQEWSNVLIGKGKYASASNEVKLRITAALEEAFLEKYYRIPLCGSTSAFLLGYQVSYITEKYNIMYDFGGFRLMKYNYTNAQWSDYVKKNGGKIDYK